VLAMPFSRSRAAGPTSSPATGSLATGGARAARALGEPGREGSSEGARPAELVRLAADAPRCPSSIAVIRSSFAAASAASAAAAAAAPSIRRASSRESTTTCWRPVPAAPCRVSKQGAALPEHPLRCRRATTDKQKVIVPARCRCAVTGRGTRRV
jgi:hypothetical protein